MRLSRAALQRLIVLYAARHLFGIGVLTFVAVSAFRSDLPLVGWTLLVALPVYAGSVFVTLRSFLRTYRRNVPPSGAGTSSGEGR